MSTRSCIFHTRYKHFERGIPHLLSRHKCKAPSFLLVEQHMIAAQSGTGHVFVQMSKLKLKSELESYSYFQLLHCTFQEVLYQASEFADLNINSGLNFIKT